MDQLVSLRTVEEDRFERLRQTDRAKLTAAAEQHLHDELAAAIEGEVRFDRGSRALYATDGSNYRQVPIGVVIPATIGDVEQTVQIAARHRAPLLSRGCGTSLAGQCCNVAVVMDFSKRLHHVLEVDAARRLARVQPSCVLDTLRHTAERQGLTFGPDPSTHSHCTLGGMLGNNSCGIHSLISHNAGLGLRASDNTHELEVLTYRGLRLRVGKTSPEELDQIIAAGGPRGGLYRNLKEFRDRYADEIRARFPQLPRRVSGYNLDELLPENGFHLARALVGSEGTLVTILEATLHLVPAPGHRSLLVLGYPSIYEACKHLQDILKFNPTGLEGLDHLLLQWVRQEGEEAKAIHLMPEGKGFLLVEFGGATKQESDTAARECMEHLKKLHEAPSTKLFDNPADEHLIWKVREGGLGSTAWVQGHPDSWPGWEDSAVATERVDEYLPRLRDLFQKYGYEASLYGHFGQGCIHCRVPFDLYTHDGIAKYRRFMNEAADLVVEMGGSLSGEHGDGQARAELLPKMFGPKIIAAFEEFKRIWDPDGQMNPGKVVHPNAMDADLRIGADYHPPHTQTHFQFPEDEHSFGRAALRCVGVGNCRRQEGGVMCPSYMVTREEKHSTRGRAHLLFEMLNGEVIDDGWKSEEVKEALDLCLACKGCKNDCPVNVDMATYKAEFLSHYYEGRLRPRHAYAMGWIFWWARLASLWPQAANFFSQTPVLRDVAKWLGGISPKRQMPAFASETFKAWWQRRPASNVNGTPVILWSDTFTNHFHPEIARSAVAVLETLGYRVEIPCSPVCCGRPLYDFGMLDSAKMLLEQVLEKLRPALRAGLPIVVLEPSCLSVFRDEVIGLFPSDEDAQRLKRQACSLAELLARNKDFTPPRLEQQAIVQAHCHHRSVIGYSRELQLLKEMGLQAEFPEPSCCGMAGSFGFEEGEHYDMAQACGEKHLLPAVRKAADDTLLVADGFSCHEQIRQGTGRTPLHLAQVLEQALCRAGRLPMPAERPTQRLRRATRNALCTGAVILGIAGLVWCFSKRSES